MDEKGNYVLQTDVVAINQKTQLYDLLYVEDACLPKLCNKLYVHVYSLSFNRNRYPVIGLRLWLVIYQS